MKKLGLSFLLVISYIGITFSQVIPDSVAYLGQTPPGSIRKIFNLAVEQGYSAAEKIAISPDGKEIYFEETNWVTYKFKYYKFHNDQWIGPFSLLDGYYCLSLSPDGNSMYFGNGSYNNCWISNKLDTIWNTPLRFLKNFNVHSLNVTSLGNYFMSSNSAEGLGQRDICKLNIVNSDTSLIGLGLPLNSSANEGDFFIANDESFIIVMSNRSGGFGSTDLYLSFKKNNETWTNPKNMGTSINTSSDDFGPYVTADNKYLFYESGYTNPSLYWVKVDELIDSLQQTNFIPYLNNPISNQTDSVGNLFTFIIPDSTFIDDDGNNTLTYSATLSNGNALPSWLTFDSNSKSFSGTPTEAGSFIIKVKATDTEQASISCTFTLKVEQNNPNAIDPINEQNIHIYPNPTNGLLNINFDTMPNKVAIVEIFDMLGKSIYFNIFQNFTSLTIDLTGYQKGNYILKLNIDGEILNKKIVLD